MTYHEMTRITVLFMMLSSFLSALSTVQTTQESDKALAVFWSAPGNAQNRYNKLVETKLKEIGFNLTDPHKRVNDQYKTKYGNTLLDVLSFLPVVNDDVVMPLFKDDPRVAGFSPFNMLIYKTLEESNSHVGHLMPSAMLDILGVTDPEVRKRFSAPFKKLDALMDKEFGKENKHYLLYHNPTKQKMLTFEYTFQRDEDFDMDDFLEEFQNKFELAFIDKNYLIAGYHNFFETDNGEEVLENTFDAFWTYSLCHLTYSYNIFDTKDARPDAGLYAPCTMYVYIKKDSNKMILGMPALTNVKNTLNITHPKRVGWMDRLDKEIPQILTAMGMQAVESVNPIKETPKPIKIDMTPPTPVPGTIAPKGEKSVPSAKAVSAPKAQSQKPQTIQHSKAARSMSSPKEHTVNNGTDTLHITIPQPPKVPTPVKVETENANDLNSRAIKFSKRYPPGYVPIEKRLYQEKTQVTTNNVGGVNAERISTYLRAPYIDEKRVRKQLEEAGFRIIAKDVLDKKKNFIVLVFTNDILEKFAADNNAEFLASLRVLINKKDNHISITNPLYFAKAFMPTNFKEEVPKTTLEKIKKAFKGLANSKDRLKFQQLPHYKFMNGMPEFKDMVEVAQGSKLIENIKGKKQVVFEQHLSNGAVLIGLHFKRRTEKFPQRIGTNNAALLPYPVLIKEGKAYMMDPKYYISVMYPLLKMSEFMTIATIPDAILKEAQRVFRKKK